MQTQKFKQTEIGAIPEDWNVQNIKEICSEIVRGPFGGALKKECFVDKGIKVYEQKNAIYSDVDLGNYYIDDIKFVELKRFEIKEGDFIISCSGTIGKIFQIPKTFEKGIINQALLKIKINTSVCSEKYFLHYFRWERFQQKIIESTQGGAMKNLIGMPEFKKTLIPLPKLLEEQSAIASVLSDTDALIESLDKLIVKKKNIKQGAMQELLTGKRRLPGFKGEWEVKKLGDVTEIKKGQLITDSTRIDGSIPVIAGGKTPAYYHNKANRLGKTITISCSGASAGYIAFHNFPIFASDCSTIEESKKYSIEYIYFLLQLIQEKIYKMQTGGAQPHIHPSDLKPIVVSVPLSSEEQSAIASILSDMDAEIKQLERKRHKYEDIKTGMMQELLTGRIRLK